MIKHFCDICKNEMTERTKVNITAKEVCGEGYLQITGEKLMDTDYEFCSECYNKLVDIVGAIGQEEPFTIDKLRKLIKSGEEERL